MGIINSLIYHPPQKPYSNLPNINHIPSQYNNDIYFTLYKSNNPKYIIFSHGNASDISSIHNYLHYLYKQLDCNVIGYDYSGYGLSTGELSENNCYDSLSTIIKYLLKNDVPAKNIFLIGQSLGTGVVIDIISKVKWQTPVILISPYKTIIKVVIDNPILDLFDQFTSIYKIKNVQCPIKIFHGLDENKINVQHSQDLFNEIPNKKFKPTFIPNANHDDILMKININDIKNIINT